MQSPEILVGNIGIEPMSFIFAEPNLRLGRSGEIRTHGAIADWLVF